jgi:hypothetical protein
VRESKIEAHLIREVRRLGGTAYKFVSPNRRGVPDRLVLLPDRPVFFAEIKAPGEKLRPEQKREARRIGNLGTAVLVFDSIEAVDKFFKRIPPE